MQVVHSNVAFVPAASPVREAVALMAQRNISSLLVVDAAEKVCGILTERDVVQKFTLLGAPEQAACKVEAVMSRPVHFARQDHLVEDVIALHFAHGIRHFPVLREAPAGQERARHSVVGIMSITDIARNFLHGLARSEHEARPADVALYVVAFHDAAYASYRGLFAALGYDVHRIESVLGIPLVAKSPGKAALLVDMDHYATEQLQPILAAVKATKLPAIFATSHEELFEPFQKGLAGTCRDVALKPVDVSHCHWELINWLR